MMRTKEESTLVDGIEAAHLAFKDCGVRLINGVPGYPINHLFTALQNDEGMRARWQFNEKIAYEMAMGSSVCGERAAVVCKHVGMNILSDPFIISATHGIGAGIVVIAGDDVGAVFSNDEQDSRWYGKLAEIPVFDPAIPQDMYDSITHGFQLSERISAPVLVRVTEGALEEKGPVVRKKIPDGHKKLNGTFFTYTMLGSHQRYIKDGWSHAVGEANHSSLNKSMKRSHKGIISSGHASIAASKLADSFGISHLSLGLVNPFPRALVDDFMMGLESILVCEEVSPFIEEQMGRANVRGRLTGHLPRVGPLDEPSIKSGLEQMDAAAVQRPIEPQTMSSRGYAVGHCAECSYHSVYSAIKSLGVPVAGDAGCSIISANPPYSMLNVMCGLGSAVGSACGFPTKGIAMMGDFALLHTGLQALVNAKLNGYDLLVVLFANGEAAMTGGQQLPDVTGLLRDVFKDDCVFSNASELSSDQVKSDLEKLLKGPGLKIYVVTSTCRADHEYKINPL